MAAMVGCEPPVPYWYMTNPGVSHLIRQKAKQMIEEKVYSRSEHITQLKKIRDAAMGSEKYKVALDSEIQIGKASGLYENLGEGDDQKKLPPPEELTTEQLKARIAGLDSRNAIALRMPEPDEFVSSPESDEEAF